MGVFYHKQLNLELSWNDKMILFEYWHSISILSDICTLVGTILKIQLDLNVDCKEVRTGHLGMRWGEGGSFADHHVFLCPESPL